MTQRRDLLRCGFLTDAAHRGALAGGGAGGFGQGLVFPEGVTRGGGGFFLGILTNGAHQLDHPVVGAVRLGQHFVLQDMTGGGGDVLFVQLADKIPSSL